jgi:formylglycine-generating enzyme required for sulfatase activity
MMRTLILLALAVALCAACADEPAQDATPAERVWLTDRPESAHPYSDETLARLRKLVEGDGWGDAAWNAQGTLEAVHEKTGLAFVLIPAGSFWMGSPDDEDERGPGEDRHRVRVSSFLLGTTECTQRAWDLLGGEDDREWRESGLPIDAVSWIAATAWCRKAGVRLPRESEWEYSCRAGTETPFSTGPTITTDQANYCGKYPYWDPRTRSYNEGECRDQTVAAGSLPANPWGLHEMHGNLDEWCEDVAVEEDKAAPSDGPAREDGGSGNRVLRGGNWCAAAGYCRSAWRGSLTADPEDGGVGFRPAADLPR